MDQVTRAISILRAAGIGMALAMPIADRVNAQTFELLGVESGGGTGGIGATSADCAVSGDTIWCPAGGRSVQFDIYVSDWDDGTGRDLDSFRATIDPASYENGIDLLVPRGFEENRQTGAYQLVLTCFRGAYDQLACGSYADGPFGPGQPGVTEAECQEAGGYSCVYHYEFILAPCVPHPEVDTGDESCTSPLDCPYSWSAFCAGSSGLRPEDGNAGYAGSLILEVPEITSGSWEISFIMTETWISLGYQSPAEALLPGHLHVGSDCNANGIDDYDEFDIATSADCNGNHFVDVCDLAAGTSRDCNQNKTLDDCEIAAGDAPDCDDNGIIDDCEADSDGDGFINACDRCPGVDDAVFAPECAGPIPAVSTWGLIVLALGLVVAAKLRSRHTAVLIILTCVLWASGSAAYAQTIEFVGVPHSGGQGNIGQTDPSCRVSGNTITCPQGGISVQFSLHVSDWGEPEFFDELTAVQATVDGSTLYNGEYQLLPRGFPTDPTLGAYQVVRTCFQGASHGVACGESGMGPFGPGHPGVDQDECRDAGGLFCVLNSDFVTACCDPQHYVNFPFEFNFSWGAHLGPNTGSGVIDDGTNRYLGDYVLEVPVEAHGEWTIRWHTNPNVTFLNVLHAHFFGFEFYLPAVVRIWSDCNENDVRDEEEIADGSTPDCNTNAVPDECDLAIGTSHDCNANNTPDECELDGDGDGIIDACDQCPGIDDAVYMPQCKAAIPTVSTWGLIVLALGLVVAAKLRGRHAVFIIFLLSSQLTLNGAVQAQTIEFVGVPHGGGQGGIGHTDPTCRVSGNTISCPHGGIVVQFAAYLSEWDAGLGRRIHSAQATINGATLNNGSFQLLPLGYDNLGTRRLGCYQVATLCFGGPLDGFACGQEGRGPFGPGFNGFDQEECQASGGYFCAPNLDFLTGCCDPIYGVATPSNLNYAWGAAVHPHFYEGLSYEGTPKYFGDLVLNVPLGARGEWVLGWLEDSDSAFLLNDDTSGVWPIVNFLPGVLRIWPDCNENGVDDLQDLINSTSPDCNQNSIPDECDVESNTSLDCNDNLVPDECEHSPDTDGDGIIDACDLCPIVDDTLFAPECASPIPAASTWGITILALFMLVAAKLARHSVAEKCATSGRP